MGEISLALVTYNQAHLLKQFLANYQRHGAGKVDLTLVDDGSDDSTPKILAALPKDARIHIHRLPHGSIARARNHALRTAPTPWLAFSDTDCELNATYFEILSTLPDRYSRTFPEAPAIEGAVNPPPGPKPPFTHSLANFQGGVYATANMVFKVSAALAVGGFDEHFGNYREDADLALTLLERVGAIPFCAELAVIHPHLPRNFPQSMQRAYATQAAIIRSEIRLFEKHPTTYRLIRYFPNVSATLNHWRWKYSARFVKENLGALLGSRGRQSGDGRRALLPIGKALIVAVWEHLCLIVCLLRLNANPKKSQP